MTPAQADAADWWRFVIRRWALVAGDFSREYRLERDDLARIGVPEFMWRVAGLSKQSRLLEAWADEPKHLHDPADVAALTAAMRR